MRSRRDRVDSHVLRRYEIGPVIREVEDGIVWKGVDKKTMQTVAVKKILDGFLTFTDAQRTYQEVMLLLLLRHENIIQVLNVVRSVNQVDLYLIFENMLDTDLQAVIRANFLEKMHKRYIVYQLVNVLKFLHSGNIIHRDLKPSSLLLNAECRMKLTNFRLAGLVDSETQFSEEDESVFLKEDVVERWYRAPEIVLGGKRLTKAVDMWSVGCILAELWTGQPLFPGESTTDQIARFSQLLERPEAVDIESFHSDDADVLLSSIVSRPMRKLEDLVPDATPGSHIADFFKKLFVYCPEDRMTAEQALRHPFLSDFHDEASEAENVCDCPIQIPFNINRKASIELYRSQLFHHVSRRRQRRRDRLLDRLRQDRDTRRAKYAPRRNGDSSKNGV